MKTRLMLTIFFLLLRNRVFIFVTSRVAIPTCTLNIKYRMRSAVLKK